MSRKVQLLLFLGGSALFIYLISRIGVAELAADAVRTGWMFVPIFLLYGVVYLCNAAAWGLVMADEPRRPPFWRTYAITVSGFSINFITPMINVGGEPFKIAAVSSWLGVRRAAGSVILYQMLHTLAMLLTWLAALVLALFLLPHRPVILAGVVAAMAALVGLAALLFSGHRRGGLEQLLNVLHRLPVLDRLARLLEPRRELLAQMDAQITQFYHASPRRFFQALGLEFLGRCIFVVEYCLIFLGVGVHLSYLNAFVLGPLSSLILTVLFIVPFEVGTKEGSFYVLAQLLGLNPGLGVYAAIADRLRDMAWIALGLGLIWLSGRRPAPQRA